MNQQIRQAGDLRQGRRQVRQHGGRREQRLDMVGDLGGEFPGQGLARVAGDPAPLPRGESGQGEHHDQGHRGHDGEQIHRQRDVPPRQVAQHRARRRNSA